MSTDAPEPTVPVETTPTAPLPEDAQQWGPPPLLGPAAGAPAYPAPPHPAYGPPPPRPTDGFAIVALVFGIVPLPLLAFAFGVAALLRIRRSHDGGREMAVVGMVLAGVWTVVLAVVVPLVVYAVIAQPDSSASPEPTATTAPAADLAPGDCVDDVAANDLSDMTVVGCTDPHDGQVVASFQLPGGEFRGEDATADDADEGCWTRLGSSVADRVDAGELTYYYLYPNQESWAQGDRSVDCVIAREDLGDLIETFPVG